MTIKIRSAEGFTFDGVLLLPKHSSVASRQGADPSTRPMRGIELYIQTQRANMGTVMEGSIAIALAHAGGLGVIRLFMNVEQQLKQVGKVKRAEGLIIENPYCLQVIADHSQARERCEGTKWEA